MNVLVDRPSDLVGTATRFCRALREAGLAVTPAEAVEAARALGVVDLRDREELRVALRSVLTTRPEDFHLFDELFEYFWHWDDPGEPRHAPRRPGRARPEQPAPMARPKAPPSVARWLRSGFADLDEDPLAVARESDRARLQAKDFAAFSPDELDEITREATRLARRLAARPSRRWRPASRGPRMHLRQVMRRSLRTGGDVVELTFRERRLRKTKLVLLCDVSGSMDLYSRFLLQFLYALQNCFARVETFVFSTCLSRVTHQLRRRPYAAALRGLSLGVDDWSGGTRIGECLTAFSAGWPRLVDRRTIVVVLSDGWDAGDPAALASTLASIRERAGRVVWLNPLLGSPTYRPETRGMAAALPHLDVFAPVHNLASLRALARHLVL
ncbi:MAG: VWA domain-containing protein [Gemmatimonadaceae bacterium]